MESERMSEQVEKIMNVRFRKPPIDELIIGIYFNPPLFALRSEHIGMLWSRLRNEFPKVEQQEPIGPVPIGPMINNQEEVVTIDGEFLVMPRFWFKSEDEVNLIQVQKNAFLLNWRRRETEYPHFAKHLKPSFDKYYNIFEKFLQEDAGVTDPRIGLCELTYVNIIEPSDFWQGPQDTVQLIPSFSIPNCELDHSVISAFNCSYRYEISSHLQLHIAVRTVTAASDPGSPRLSLEFKALGHLGSVQKSDTEVWYGQAHDAIISCFQSMTNKEVQHTYWMLEEETE